MDGLNYAFLSVLGVDLTTLQEYIPFLEESYQIMQYTAWCLLFFVILWQLIRSMGGPVTNGENPFVLLSRGVLFAFCIGLAKQIFVMVFMSIGKVPYNQMLNLTSESDSEIASGEIAGEIANGVFGRVIEAFSKNTMILATGVGTILVVILIIAIGWNYFKLLLESVERYVFLGVLAYTSPLAFAAGASQSTINVFKAWCRMVASQLLLLLMNVWFIRGFTSMVGKGFAEGGALQNSEGNILIWSFCALAWLKIGQRIDTYLASLGMNAAQTGSSMAGEMMMAYKAIEGTLRGRGGTDGFAGRAGSVFTNPSGGGGGAGGGAATMAGAFANFASRRGAANYAADANAINGAKTAPFSAMGWVARQAAGAQTAISQSGLSGAAISRVANNPSDPRVLGTEAVNRGLANGNYFSNLAGRSLSGTQVSSGRISTTATNADGSKANLDYYNSGMYDQPEGSSVVTAADGSSWYQVASGAGRGEFLDTPSFSGAESLDDYQAAFPSIDPGTSLRTVDDGMIAAAALDVSSGDSATDIGSGAAAGSPQESMWYSSGFFNEPEQPHTAIQDSNGTSWYQVTPAASIPETSEAAATILPGAGLTGAISFTPNQEAGTFDAISGTGSGTRFYDAARYAEPNAPHQTMQDISGHQWYAVAGQQNGTSISYGSAPKYFGAPTARSIDMPQEPRRKAAAGGGSTKKQSGGNTKRKK